MTRPAAPRLPTVSVVIPVLDDAEALRRCLAQLSRQTRQAAEVVVVDNGCTDASAQVARNAGARVVAEPRRGIAAAASAGYDAARGDVVARCDADSLPGSDWVERISTRFAADPALDGLTGSGTFYDRRWIGGPLCAAYLCGYRWLAGAAASGVPLWGSNCAFRRSAWLRVRGRVHRLRGDVHDDLDFSLQLLPEGRTAYDAALRVGVCGRMFHSLGQFARRFRWAWTTLRLEWERESPGLRWLRARRIRRVGGAG